MAHGWTQIGMRSQDIAVKNGQSRDPPHLFGGCDSNFDCMVLSASYSVMLSPALSKKRRGVLDLWAVEVAAPDFGHNRAIQHL